MNPHGSRFRRQGHWRKEPPPPCGKRSMWKTRHRKSPRRAAQQDQCGRISAAGSAGERRLRRPTQLCRPPVAKPLEDPVPGLGVDLLGTVACAERNESRPGSELLWLRGGERKKLRGHVGRRRALHHHYRGVIDPDALVRITAGRKRDGCRQFLWSAVGT